MSDSEKPVAAKKPKANVLVRVFGFLKKYIYAKN